MMKKLCLWKYRACYGRQSLLLLLGAWICACPVLSQDFPWIRSYQEGLKQARDEKRVQEKAGSPLPPTVVDLSASELLARYPEELSGVRFEASQDELGPLLKMVGEKVREFIANFSNTASTERLRQESLKPNGKISDHVDQEVEYLMFLKKDGSAFTWEEERTDHKGKPVRLKRLPQESFLTSGFAMDCIFFFPDYQLASRFRYLGRQTSEPFAYVISYAQRPEKGFSGTFRTRGVSIAVWSQGLVWVDPNSYQIIRMKTDLLAPRLDIGLTRLTTEISYAEHRLGAKGVPLWLPRDVVVTTEFSSRLYRNFHQYSDYRLFSVESYEKHEAILPPRVPK